jgi:hypothetical protein
MFEHMHLPGAGIYVAPSLNHAGCVLTTSESFLFFYLLLVGENKSKNLDPLNSLTEGPPIYTKPLNMLMFLKVISKVMFFNITQKFTNLVQI